MLQQVGAYHIVRQLGQGGMGAVFEGVHEQTQQRVAIKMLLPHLSHQPEVVRRFFNEARAVGMAGHPSIVDVFDVGRLDDGTAYMVIEFLDGETLRAHLERNGRLGPGALPIVRDIAAALAQAHAKQIIHRDLKPENVMLVPSPDGLRVKVLDFGIAKIAQDAELAAGMGVRTKTGMVLGTPTYMSPEQCRGTGVGAPTDVYALGAMLHQLVAGQPPFVGAGMGDVLAMHIYEAPPPLSQLVAGVDPAIEELTLQMLAKQADQRPTMAAVLRLVDDLVAGRRPSAATVVLSPSSSAPTQLSLGAPVAPARRSRGLWFGVAGGVIAAAAIAAVVIARAPGNVTTTPTTTPPTITSPTPSTTPPTTATPHPAPSGAATGAAAPSGASATAGSILWLVKSEPGHADVVRLSDGTLLGRTPWYTEQPPGHGSVEVIVRKSGFADEHVTLDAGANTTLHVRLTRRASTSKHNANSAKEDDLDVKPLK